MKTCKLSGSYRGFVEDLGLVGYYIPDFSNYYCALISVWGVCVPEDDDITIFWSVDKY
jgi:hypothetical protein